MGSVMWKYSEAKLAKVLGIQRKLFRQARDKVLMKHLDWESKEGVVLYSEFGLIRALRAVNDEPLLTTAPKPKICFGRPLVAIQACCDVNGAHSDEDSTIIHLQVVRTYMNRKMLEASLNGSTMRVRVRENHNFIPGIWIPCEQIQDDLWEFKGVCPRSPSEARRKYRERPAGPTRKRGA